ncbi:MULTISPECIES: ferredoxin [unclassified Streptomyces]|jgi:ferredoxin|uniref:ferredoxin n=1 Tax=unclassified Streptomyces TaxID=2593676 RepID=UPI0008815373|nr:MULTISPECIES: ferredoxin [unclassified Streptomyces]MDX2730492.1 ferredoxin [Streptomyces sp. PA03-2a]MDX3770388.1 ferredoxin [Streptomyces sp. AK08-01B]MDX3819856.1 ferredoxin [Streptomyces sp. AK08-01A]SCZ15018.1 Ferredoxin [Streptomyces sp. 136MFCol5.1]
MRIVVDLNKCQGYAQCAFLAPDVFAMHGEEALIYNPRADEDQHENVARAVAACPVQAILADAPDTPGERAAAPGEEESHGR